MPDDRCYDCDGVGIMPTSLYHNGHQIFADCLRCRFTGQEPPHNSREIYASNRVLVELEIITSRFRKKDAKP